MVFYMILGWFWGGGRGGRLLRGDPWAPPTWAQSPGACLGGLPLSGFNLTDDLSYVRSLVLDLPIVIEVAVKRSITRWRDTQIASHFSLSHAIKTVVMPSGQNTIHPSKADKTKGVVASRGGPPPVPRILTSFFPRF